MSTASGTWGLTFPSSAASAADAAPFARRRAPLPWQIGRALTPERDPSDAEDISKVEAYLAGDDRAFEFLFDKYREKVYRIAYRFVRDKEDALEIAQDVFLRVHLSIRKFRTNSKFFTWLYRITANRSIDFVRSRKSHATVDVEPAFLEAHDEQLPGRSPAPDPSARAVESEIEEKLAIAVDALPEKHRLVFVLHARENLSYRQIAEIVECNIGTVMSRLFYARRKLREHLQRLGVDPPFSTETAS